jgi:hypothetical protein
MMFFFFKKPKGWDKMSREERWMWFFKTQEEQEKENLNT